MAHCGLSGTYAQSEIRLRSFQSFGETAFACRRGNLANQFSSVRHGSLAVAKSFMCCRLAQSRCFVCLLPVASCCGLCRRDVTRSVTRLGLATGRLSLAKAVECGHADRLRKSRRRPG
jgi:hypothetical protein